jgi:hypothetical protein
MEEINWRLLSNYVRVTSRNILNFLPARPDSTLRFDTDWSLSGPYALNTFPRNHKQHGEIVTILLRNVLYPRRTKFELTAAHDPETIGVHLMWGSWRHISALHKVKNRARRIRWAVL